MWTTRIRLANRGHVFDTAGVDDAYLNARRQSDSAPTTPGRRAVLARFVLLDGSEEWRPAMVVRSTDKAVLVASHSGPPEYTWLDRDDIAAPGGAVARYFGPLR
jgi:hypothetical protein